MDFVRASTKLTNEDENLSVLPLKILQPLRDLYDALLVQPLGAMQATEQHIGHVDQDSAVKLYRDLLGKACEHEVDLVVTPEYCLPWQVIEEISETGLKPKLGALWVLGCESIAPDALNAFKAKQTQKNIDVLYETPRQQNKNYFCPLVYVFWTNDANDEPKLCMLIQFKTMPSKTPSENDHLYCGNDVYVFGDEVNEINFFSLICADVFEFTEEQIKNNHRDSLILHIQLNEKPWHPTFTQYRNHLFSVGSNNHVELMCLNWATGVTWDNNGDPDNVATWNYVGNSAFYIPRRLLQKFHDTNLDAIHKNGIYYNRVHSHWDGLFLNNAAQAILIKKQPIRSDGAQVLAMPWRLQFLKRFIPNVAKDAWIEANEASDGFTELLAEYKPADPNLQEGFDRFEANLREAHDASPLAVERSLELLQGPEGQPSSWHKREELHALEVAPEESPRRVTVHQEKCSTRKGAIFRKQRVQVSYDTATLYTQSLPWPKLVEDIGQGFTYQWRKDNPHSNVVPLGAAGNPATLIYLNPSMPGEARSNYIKMVKSLREHAVQTSAEGDCIESMIRAKDRLCVVYREDHGYKFLHEPDGKKSIAVPGGQSSTSVDAEDNNGH